LGYHQMGGEPGDDILRTFASRILGSFESHIFSTIELNDEDFNKFFITK
jgi:hypothetical protein